MFRRNFWVSDKNLALLRQKRRPSLYFFRSLRERNTARRHRSQGFRRTIGDSILRWSSNNSPQNSNQPRAEGSASKKEKSPVRAVDTQGEAATGQPWDLEKGRVTTQDMIEEPEKAGVGTREESLAREE